MAAGLQDINELKVRWGPIEASSFLLPNSVPQKLNHYQIRVSWSQLPVIFCCYPLVNGRANVPLCHSKRSEKLTKWSGNTLVLNPLPRDPPRFIAQSDLMLLRNISVDLSMCTKAHFWQKEKVQGKKKKKNKLSIYSKSVRLQSGVIALKGAGLKLLFYKY